MLDSKPKSTLHQLILQPKNFAFIITSLVGFSLSFFLISLGISQNRGATLDTRSQANLPTYNCTQITNIPNVECQALAQLFASTNGQNWYFSQGESRWFETVDPCRWTGIVCGQNQRITNIELVSRNLVGSLPKLVWGNLPALVTLDFRANLRLTSDLPTDMEHLPLGKLLTLDTNLCLPPSLTEWYQRISLVDALPQCPTITPTPRPCDELCTTNSECASNLSCYQIGNTQRCRLAGNPSSASCQGIPDLGLDFECNHYCSNTGECAKEFTCYYNRCRHPDNVQSASCQPPTAQIQAKMTANCNQTCATNKDCAINMRCYSGVCRLATHPENSKCLPMAPVAATQPSASTSTPKGGVQTTGSPTIKPILSVSPRPSTQPEPEATTAAAITPQVSLTPSPDTAPKPESALTALLKNLSQKLQDRLSSAQNSNQIKIGLGIIGLGFILIILAKILPKGKKSNQANHDNITPPPSSMIDRVKEKNII